MKKQLLIVIPADLISSVYFSCLYPRMCKHLFSMLNCFCCAGASQLHPVLQHRRPVDPKGAEGRPEICGAEARGDARQAPFVEGRQTCWPE